MRWILIYYFLKHHSLICYFQTIEFNLSHIVFLKKKKKLSHIVVGLFHNNRLGCLLPRYSPMVLGRKLRTGLTATHPKPTNAQARASLLRPWTRAHGRGNCYKKVMADKGNMTIIRRICLLSAKRTENTKSWS